MQTGCELSSRTQLRAFRAGQDLLILAEGELPTPGYRVDIQQDPRRIFPPHFDLLRCPLPGIWPDVVTPFRYCEVVPYPDDQAAVTVHHAEGADQVTIEEHGPALSAYGQAVQGSPDRPCPEGADQAVGFSASLSFDEAFAAAVAKLPPLDGHPDTLARVQVAEIGGLFGGIAGFRHLFVRVCRTHD
jgi:hypothetical protein